MLTRRQVLQRSLVMSLAPVIPSFLNKTAGAAGAEKDRRVLVVVQLDGGNDGLNTVVPFRDESYARLRPKLKIEPVRLIKLNDDLAFHPSLKPLAEMHEDGQISIVQGVGYPNPDRSHFRSMAVWHTARLEESQHGQYGWLGRALDLQADSSTAPQAIYSSTGSVPVALWGRRSTTAVIKSKRELTLDAPVELLRAAAVSPSDRSALVQFAAGASAAAFATCDRLAPVLAAEHAVVSDDQPTRLGGHLAIISTLIKSGSSARVFYASQSGYDTHAAQTYDHSRLLGELANAISKFFADLKASGLADRVLLLAFSEFGRRAAENASEGTDHGSAGPVLLAGTKLASGVVGSVPNLNELVQGDVKTTIDFRQVYASVLERWLEVPPMNVLDGAFEPLPLFKA